MWVHVLTVPNANHLSREISAEIVELSAVLIEDFLDLRDCCDCDDCHGGGGGGGDGGGSLHPGWCRALNHEP